MKVARTGQLALLVCIGMAASACSDAATDGQGSAGAASGSGGSLTSQGGSAGAGATYQGGSAGITAGGGSQNAGAPQAGGGSDAGGATQNQAGTTQGGAAQGGTAQGGAVQGGSDQGGSAQGGTDQGGSAQGGVEQGGNGGVGGAVMPSVDCGITVDSAELSSAIPTVGIITWSATGQIDGASVNFGLAGGELNFSAPVDLDEPGYRTLLLGMKEGTDYDYQVVATSGTETCTSERATITTEYLSNNAPTLNRSAANEAAISPGFIVSVDNMGGAFIVDADLDLVWYAPAPRSASRARMSWDSKYMWMVTGNPNGGMGELRRISMDGLQEDTVPGDAHHDLAPLPDGSIIATMHSGDCSSIVEVDPDLNVTTRIADVGDLYTPAQQCHPNSIIYHPEDDTLTISDRNPNLYVKVDRIGGAVHWQLGGQNPLGPHIPLSWQVNHGHQILPNGNFLFFNNNGRGGGQGGTSEVHELAIDYEALTAEIVFTYSSNESSFSLGDAQRLPNGNTLITYSNQGTLHEVDGDGQLVQTITTGALGYAMHRVSLYGAPPK